MPSPIPDNSPRANCDTSSSCPKWSCVVGTGCFPGCYYSYWFRPTELNIMAGYQAGNNTYDPVSLPIMLSAITSYVNGSSGGGSGTGSAPPGHGCSCGASCVDGATCASVSSGGLGCDSNFSCVPNTTLGRVCYSDQYCATGSSCPADKNTQFYFDYTSGGTATTWYG